jgi:hypothetical protein
VKRFKLIRDEDPTGISGTGFIAEGIVFDDGQAVVRWRTKWPTSVVFHDRGIESVVALHGHDGATRIEWVD